MGTPGSGVHTGFAQAQTKPVWTLVPHRSTAVHTGVELVRTILSSAAPVLANVYLLIKVHKKNFPGRAVVNQMDDPTYKICKILTDILNPLAIQSRSYIENSFELKKVLKSVTIDPDNIQASFDVRSLYPSIPIQKTLQITRDRLYTDDTLPDRTKWNPDDIIKLLEICQKLISRL